MLNKNQANLSGFKFRFKFGFNNSSKNLELAYKNTHSLAGEEEWRALNTEIGIVL